MILYHFAAAHMVNSIKQEGLTLGTFPLYKDGKWSLIERCQWLTSESDPRKQSWATNGLIDYDRTDYKLTIQIPKSHFKKLIRAIDFVKDMSEESADIVTGWSGSNKWYVFLGRIPPKWIIGFHCMIGGKHN